MTVENVAPDPWITLAKEQFLSLTSYRKNGQGVPTPVWFARMDGLLVVYTMESSGKVKRIRNNPTVEVAACNRSGKIHGPPLPGVATFLHGSAAKRAETLLNNKYPLKRVMNLFAQLRGSKRAYLAIAKPD
ncbi:MAG: PPOX class F420-dependent oxidoreductase [Herpetosiphon sp.]